MPRGRPSTKQTAPAFGKRLRNLRRDRGFTQATLARVLGVMQQTVSDYEMGGAWPSPPILIRLAKVLHVSTDEILGVRDLKVPHLKTSTARLWTRFKKLQALKPANQASIWTLIEIFFEGHEARQGAASSKGPRIPPTS